MAEGRKPIVGSLFSQSKGGIGQKNNGTMRITKCVALGAILVSLTLAGCGSTGTGTGAVSTTTSPAATVSGVAASGAPIAGVVQLKDASTPAKVREVTAGSDGSFSIDVSGLTPPFMLRVVWNPGTTLHYLVSFAPGAGTANITPLSNVIVANAAGVNDPLSLYDTVTAPQQRLIANAIAGSTTILQTQLKSLFTLFGVTSDPISGSFVANHTGLDALLDAVTASIVNGTFIVTNTASNAVIFTAPVMNMSGGTFTTGNMPAAPVAPGTNVIDGAALYAVNCAGCHGPLATSAKKGATAARIQTGISTVGAMSSFSSLTADQVQAIANALNGIPTTPASTTPPPTTPPPATTPGTVDGAVLYTTDCAGCHGPLATSAKAGTTVALIQTGISTVGAMSSFSTLSLAQIQAIATVLATSPPTTTPGTVDGAVLYTTNCAGCHGPLATSAKAGTTVALIQTGISTVGAMTSFSSLSLAQIQAIATALNTPSTTPPPPVPTDGPTLYATYCASCHRTLAQSEVRGKSATSITSAIRSVSKMSSLSGLTATQISAIATALK